MSLEKKGIPTATFVTHAFEKYARGLSTMQGMEALRLVVIPHPIAARPTEELREKVRRVYPDVHLALIRTES